MEREECRFTTAIELLESLPETEGAFAELLQSTSSDSRLDTTDWNTYESDTWGFSLRYPNTWRLDVRETNSERGGIWIYFFTSVEGLSIPEHIVLTMRVSDLKNSDITIIEGSRSTILIQSPQVSIRSSSRDTAGVRFNVNRRRYGFSDHFTTVPERDWSQTVEVVRSLRFICP